MLLFGVWHTFQKVVLPNLKEIGWAQAEDLLVPLYMTLNSNPEAWLAWFHIGASLAAQLFSVNAAKCKMQKFTFHVYWAMWIH